MDATGFFFPVASFEGLPTREDFRSCVCIGEPGRCGASVARKPRPRLPWRAVFTSYGRFLKAALFCRRLLLREGEAICLFAAGRAFFHIGSSLAVSHNDLIVSSSPVPSSFSFFKSLRPLQAGVRRMPHSVTTIRYWLRGDRGRCC
jgi:hypothetical protein